MVVPEQYGQYLYAASATADSTQDSDGNIVDAQGGAASWILIGRCREETNGRGSQVRTNDGRTAVFSSLIQMPKGSTRIMEGTQVMIAERTLTAQELAGDLSVHQACGVIRAVGQNLKYDKGSLHDRLWI